MNSTNKFGDCMALYERLIKQLDTLVPFLALAHQEIFVVLSDQYSIWYSDERQDTLPDTFEAYTHQVSHAAFLLGYSYAEAFVTDLMWLIYSIRKDLLPKDKTLRYEEILSRNDFDNVVRHMIDSTISDMNSLEKKIFYLENRFGLNIPQPILMKDAHVARNALVHNAGRVNRSCSTTSRWNEGDIISLSVSEVHDFGIMARDYTWSMCECAEALCRA